MKNNQTFGSSICELIENPLSQVAPIQIGNLDYMIGKDNYYINRLAEANETLESMAVGSLIWKLQIGIIQELKRQKEANRFSTFYVAGIIHRDYLA